MYGAMCAKITFEANHGRESIVIKKPSAMYLKSSWKRLTDTATIIMPRNVKFFDKNKVNDVFRAGDPVTIEFGYNGNLNKEFKGYIRSVSADKPIVIECEDEMYKLKKLPVNVSYKSVMLQKLLETIAPGYTVDALEVNIGAVRFSKMTVAGVLEQLKREFGFYSYMKGQTLVCGKVYADDSDLETKTLHLERSLAENNLQYRNAEDIRIKLIAVSTLTNGKKITVTVGDQDGEQRKLTYFNVPDVKELEKLANVDYKKYKVSGFKGTIATFGIPVINHGSKVRLTSTLYPDRNGVYYVESVDVDFDPNPYIRRILTLGEKVAA